MSANREKEFAELSQFELDPAAIRMLPRPFCERTGVVILEKPPASKQKPIALGMRDPTQESLRYAIADLLQRPVRAVRLNRYEIDKAIKVGYESELTAEAGHVIRPRLLRSRPSVPELVDHVIAGAVTQKASDIHIETYLEDVDVRYRIAGILHQIYTDVDPETVRAVASRIKVMANLDITERRRPQDGRIRCSIVEGKRRTTVDLRVSVVPAPFGEDVVIRLLDPQAGLIPLAELGMPPDTERILSRLLANPEGLILVTGPTGSGKTTTLYAALAQVNDGRRKIVTAEDPIEYYVPKINQKQVSTTMSMLDLLRALLRHDPNVILVGEIRDRETGNTALSAAATGHLVLSTLHTADAVGAIPRLRGLGLDNIDIANTLLAVIAQRLVRRTCPDCLAETEAAPEQQELFGRLIEGIALRAGKGCAACYHTGYRGRTGIYEILVADDPLQDMVAADEPGVALRRRAAECGMKTLLDDGLAKAKDGVTTLDELARVVPYRQIVVARDRQPKRIHATTAPR